MFLRYPSYWLRTNLGRCVCAFLAGPPEILQADLQASCQKHLKPSLVEEVTAGEFLIGQSKFVVAQPGTKKKDSSWSSSLALSNSWAARCESSARACSSRTTYSSKVKWRGLVRSKAAAWKKYENTKPVTITSAAIARMHVNAINQHLLQLRKSSEQRPKLIDCWFYQ